MNQNTEIYLIHSSCSVDRTRTVHILVPVDWTRSVHKRPMWISNPVKAVQTKQSLAHDQMVLEKLRKLTGGSTQFVCERETEMYCEYSFTVPTTFNLLTIQGAQKFLARPIELFVQAGGGKCRVRLFKTPARYWASWQWPSAVVLVCCSLLLSFF